MTTDELVGRVFAHYRVLARIGAGGMGVVYLAHDEQLDRDVVLKLLPEETIGDVDARERLLDEARKAAALNHPNICTIHEVGESEGQVYFVMEQVEGQPLGERIGPRGLPVETAVALAIQIADAIAHAHDRGIVHRDLKSGNVIVTPEGRAKVLDFGIARRVDPASQATSPGANTVTGTGGLAGTARYLPPEVYRGERADARGDVWALGVILQEMLTGEPPFRGGTGYELGAAILNAAPAVLPVSVPGAVRSVVQRCLCKDPTGRFQRASEVRAVLEMARMSPGTPALASEVAVIPGRGDRRRFLTTVAGLAILVAGIVTAGVLLRARRAADARTIRTIAVLPLENLSADPAQEYFADGMTEELITSLANLEGVRVIARTSVMRYKRTTKPVREIARELGVDAVIEGAALRVGERVRITAQLIHGSNEHHLWAKSYEGDLRDVLALQGQVAEAISTEIRTALTTAGRERAKNAVRVNPEAYEEYLKGRYEWGKRTRESLVQSIAHFERAIAADPSYAPAWAGLGDVYTVSHGYLRQPARETFPKALASVREALRLDPRLAQAHATLGALKYQFEHDWAGADEEFRRALAHNPSYATAHQWYGLYLARSGKLAEGLAEVERAWRLDPLSPVIATNRVAILHWQRRTDEALAAADQVVERYPGFSPGRFFRGRIYLVKHRYPEALAEFVVVDSLDGESVHRDERVRAALLANDERGYWRRVLEIRVQQTKVGYVEPGHLVVAHAQVGDMDGAIEWLEKALQEGDAMFLFYLRDVLLDPLRTDPRYTIILRRHGLNP